MRERDTSRIRSVFLVCVSLSLLPSCHTASSIELNENAASIATKTRTTDERIAKTRATRQQVLAASAADDWRALAPEQTLYLEFAHGRVVFELAERFAPAHLANLAKLLKSQYFDGLSVVRVQDNYVAQWGDANANSPDARSLGDARATLDGEYFRSARGLNFATVASQDVYANEVGFVDGFPAGREGPDGNAWLLHCYGALGVGRDVASNSGNSAELYAVIGHSPRHLDRNVTLIGHARSGIEALSSLPRGTGQLGFYEPPTVGAKIQRLRLGTDVPIEQRLDIEVLRTDTDTFAAWVAASTYRSEEWFIDPAGHIEICNIPIPSRPSRP